MALPIPRLSYEALRGRADAVLGAHNPNHLIPVPIEQIVEFGFGLNIIPVPGLQTVHEVDAFTSRDLRTIIVDLAVFESRSPNRYRFSLAHELAHVVLHADVYAQIHFSSIAEWKRVILALPEPDREWLEWQAYNFAGLLLVPRESLTSTLAEAVQMASDKGFGERLAIRVQNSSYRAKSATMGPQFGRGYRGLNGHRFQLTTDGFVPYIGAVEMAWGGRSPADRMFTP